METRQATTHLLDSKEDHKYERYPRKGKIESLWKVEAGDDIVDEEGPHSCESEEDLESNCVTHEMRPLAQWVNSVWNELAECRTQSA